MLSRVLLWLFVLNLGIAFGAGLYESRIVVPQWFDRAEDGSLQWNADAARQANTGVRFWVFVSTIPLTLLAIANLIAGLRAIGRIRNWWIGAAAASLADRLFTFAYFIPTMIRLMGDPGVAAPEATATALQWIALNHLRHAIVLVAWLLSLRALSLSAPASA